jgi:hypothetical protein
MSAPDQRPWPLWPWVALAAGGLIVATTAAILSGVARSAGSADPKPTQTVQVTQTVATTVTRVVTPSPAPPAAEPVGPAAEFDDGQHVVAVDVVPGVYQTAGPSGANADRCYWARKKAAGSNVIEYGVFSRGGTITVNAGELIETVGCQRFTKAG